MRSWIRTRKLVRCPTENVGRRLRRPLPLDRADPVGLVGKLLRQEGDVGFLGTEGIKWNFTKFLVEQRRVVRRYAEQRPEKLVAIEAGLRPLRVRFFLGAPIQHSRARVRALEADNLDDVLKSHDLARRRLDPLASGAEIG